MALKRWPAQRLMRSVFVLMLGVCSFLILAQTLSGQAGDSSDTPPTEISPPTLPTAESAPPALPTAEVIPPTLPTTEVIPPPLPTVESIATAEPSPSESTATPSDSPIEPTITPSDVTPIVTVTDATVAPVEIFAPEPQWSLAWDESFTSLSDTWQVSGATVPWEFGLLIPAAASDVPLSNVSLSRATDPASEGAVELEVNLRYGGAALQWGPYQVQVMNGELSLWEGPTRLKTLMLVGVIPGDTATLRLSISGGTLRARFAQQDLAANIVTPLPLTSIHITALLDTLTAADYTSPLAQSGTALALRHIKVFLPHDQVTPTPITPTAEPTTATIIIPTSAPTTEGDTSSLPNVPLPTTGENDNFADAIALFLRAEIQGQNDAATWETLEPKPLACATQSGHSVWYKIQAPRTEPLRVRTMNASFDPVIGVYFDPTAPFNGLADLRPQGCNDDDLVAQTMQSNTTFPAVAGVTYWIQVSVSGTQPGGTFTLILERATLPVPPVPTLANPPGGARSNMSSTTLAWNGGPFSTQFRYKVEVATNGTFTANRREYLVMHPTMTQLLPSADYNSLTEGTTLYWRVFSMNENNQVSAPSLVRTLVIDRTPPTPPTPVSPPAHQVSATRPTLTWKGPTDARGYVVELRSEPGGSITLYNTTIASLALSQLIPGHYSWRVQARDEAGNTGTFGPSWLFTFNHQTAPANNTQIETTAAHNTLPISFTWTSLGTGVQSHLEIALDPQFEEIFHEVEAIPGSQVSLAVGTLPLGTYYWRVSKQGQQPYAGLYNVLIVTPKRPTAPRMTVLPPTNQTQPTLSWSASVGVDLEEYQLQFSPINGFNDGLPIVATHSLEPQFTLETPLQAGTHWVRVRATNEWGGASLWSTPISFIIDVMPPAVPTVTAPAHNAITTIERPVFTWKPATEAKTYLVEVAVESDPEFEYPLIESPPVTAPALTYTPTVSLPQGVYLWHVIAQDAALNQSAASTPQRLIVNLQQQPTNGFVQVVPSLSSTANVVTRWAAARRATTVSYIVELSDDETFNTPRLTSPSLSVPTFTFPSLEIGEYFWRVRVEGEDPVPGVYFRFIVSLAAPGKPTLIAQPAIIAQRRPLLSWQPPAYASELSYELQLSTSPTFTGAATVALDETEWSPEIALPTTNGQLYYWHVRALNGLNVPGLWSANSSFTLDTTPPAVPLPSAPAQAAVLTANRPVLSWAAASGAVKYKVLLSSTPALDVTPVVVTTLSWTARQLPFGTYHWVVIAVDAAGNESAPSSPRSFTLSSPLTDVPVPYVQSNVIALSWTLFAGAVEYQIQVADNSGFAGPLIDTRVYDTSYSGTALAPGVYYWHVKPYINGSLAGQIWSENFIFVVED